MALQAPATMSSLQGVYTSVPCKLPLSTFQTAPGKAGLLPCNAVHLTTGVKKILPRSGKMYPGQYIQRNLLQNSATPLGTVSRLHVAEQGSCSRMCVR